MGKFFWFLLLVLLGLAIFIGPEGNFVLTLLYLLMGAYLAGRIWSGRSLAHLIVNRDFVSHAFLGEQIPVRVEVANPGWLPLVWLQVRESLPVELAPPDSLHQVVSLGGRSRSQFEYSLDCRRRGYYSIGPMSLFTSDVLGMSNPSRSHESEHLTVFPKIVPLARVKFKSQSPIGTLRHTQPIFEDPSRIRGKRDYVAGDSLRRIDWKATAVTNRLQVKLYEPSIALETAIFLNLNTQEYHLRTAHDDTELAIILAASLASYIVKLHQSVGLFTNGFDPLQETGTTISLLPHQGRSHLLRLLEILARLQAREANPLVQLIQSDSIHLAWGTTVVLITNQVDDMLFDGLFKMRRQGIDSQLLLCGPVVGFPDVQNKADHFGFPLFQFLSERDLDIWRV